MDHHKWSYINPKLICFAGLRGNRLCSRASLDLCFNYFPYDELYMASRQILLFLLLHVHVFTLLHSLWDDVSGIDTEPPRWSHL